MLDAARITELLRPFLEDTPPQLAEQLHTYLDLLLRWNARTNLTAVRDPEQIVTRHFGESLFAARVLHDAGALSGTPTLSDIGSGAGFPGIPIKLFAPEVHLMLIESQNKKATFLREVIRALRLTDAEVFCGRAQTWGKQAQVIAMRAVEEFDQVLYAASQIIAPRGTLCLLIGSEQVDTARTILDCCFVEKTVHSLPNSERRVVYLLQDR